MRNLRLHIARLVTFLVALQILNAGFFVQDFRELSSTSSFDGYNQINSVVEFVSEVILSHTNFIRENNNHSSKDLATQKHFVYKLVEVKAPRIAIPASIELTQITTAFSPSFYSSFCRDITSPPPKA